MSAYDSVILANAIALGHSSQTIILLLNKSQLLSHPSELMIRTHNLSSHGATQSVNLSGQHPSQTEVLNLPWSSGRKARIFN